MARKDPKRPATGTEEWARKNVNLLSGCKHGCWYCYACAIAIRFGRRKPGTWTKEETSSNIVHKRWRKQAGRIMFPTAHDITRESLEACCTVLENMLHAGNEVLVVSKPDPVCIATLCDRLEPYREQVMFRFTIGSADQAVLNLWEPHAPSFHDRLAALKIAFERGYQTSVSCEPMLDDNVEAVVEAVTPHVTHSIWIGKANQLTSYLSLNGAPENVKVAGRALLALQTDDKLRALHSRLKSNPLVRWKDSIKSAVGIERPTAKGLDI